MICLCTPESPHALCPVRGHGDERDNSIDFARLDAWSRLVDAQHRLLEYKGYRVKGGNAGGRDGEAGR